MPTKPKIQWTAEQDDLLIEIAKRDGMTSTKLAEEASKMHGISISRHTINSKLSYMRTKRDDVPSFLHNKHANTQLVIWDDEKIEALIYAYKNFKNVREVMRYLHSQFDDYKPSRDVIVTTAAKLRMRGYKIPHIEGRSTGHKETQTETQTEAIPNFSDDNLDINDRVGKAHTSPSIHGYGVSCYGQ